VTNVNVKDIRQAILAAQMETANFGETPNAANLYIPTSHTKALRLESHLVIGGRGVGKSFWTAALQSPDLRRLIGAVVKDLERADVHTGFSGKPNIDQYPDMDTFAKLLGAHGSAYDIWRAVVLRRVAPSQAIPCASWEDTLNWIQVQPESVARLMQCANQKWIDDQRFGLIVFDAIDRSSNDWRTMDEIVRDLLRVALWMKSYSRLHAKVFLREDQFERTVTAFPDASKLLATQAELTWARHDLHGLLWKRLINAPAEHGDRLRHLYRSVVDSQPIQAGAMWQLPDEIKKELPSQRALFNVLAGPWMGRDPRRGVPYTWSVSHLADGRGQTSPRSFLAAIVQAAEDSSVRYTDYALPLHYESIKRGILKASEIRVAEMAEDYPWVRSFMEPLHGLNVPCDDGFIKSRWSDIFPDGPAAVSLIGLPPQHAKRGWDGVQQDLTRLGILKIKKDERIDMPDLYRVGFGLGRKGGVKPKA